MTVCEIECRMAAVIGADKIYNAIEALTKLYELQRIASEYKPADWNNNTPEAIERIKQLYLQNVDPKEALIEVQTLAQMLSVDDPVQAVATERYLSQGKLL